MFCAIRQQVSILQVWAPKLDAEWRSRVAPWMLKKVQLLPCQLATNATSNCTCTVSANARALTLRRLLHSKVSRLQLGGQAEESRGPLFSTYARVVGSQAPYFRLWI